MSTICVRFIPQCLIGIFERTYKLSRIANLISIYLDRLFKKVLGKNKNAGTKYQHKKGER